MNLSGERIYPEKCQTAEDYVLYLKHMFAYEYAKGVIKPNAKVLEIGCGTGYGTAMLADRKDLQITGLDVDASVVEFANKLYQSDNCHYMAFDGSRLPFQDEEFDAVFSFQVIEHVVDDESFLKEMSRVLKPGGHAIVVTPSEAMESVPCQGMRCRNIQQADQVELSVVRGVRHKRHSRRQRH